MSPVLLVYGATGYVGENVARTAALLGLPTIAAGRDPAKLEPISRELGIEHRAFGLDDPAALDRGLRGAAVVLNCAGPFQSTAVVIAEACLRGGAHYLDITGEIPV